MAKTHSIVNTTHCAAWDVDALNYVGIAEEDIDNGRFVALDGMNVDEDGMIKGYEYFVELASDLDPFNCYIVDSPEVGGTVEMQMMSDPRYFYNEAGKPMSLKRLQVGDSIEVDATCFQEGELPEISNMCYLNDGMLYVNSEPSAPFGFVCEGYHYIDCGQEIVPTAVMRLVMEAL